MYETTQCESKCMCMKKKRLSVVGLGFGFGVAKGLSFLLLGWCAALFGYGLPAFLVLNALYPGFVPTFVGGLIGAFWGLVCGFIFGALVAFFYNLYKKCCCKRGVCGRGEVCETKTTTNEPKL